MQEFTALDGALLIDKPSGPTSHDVVDTIRRRFYLRRQLRVYTAQGRMTGYALTALPVVVGCIIFLIQPDYLSVLFQTLFGWALVGVALLLQAIGGLWIKKIVSIDM